MCRDDRLLGRMDRGAEAQAATDPTLAESVAGEEDACTHIAGKLSLPQAIDAIALAPTPMRSASRKVDDSRPLREALLSVGWTFPADQAASQGQPDYLDGSCLIYAEERLIDVVDFRGAHSAGVGCHSQKASSATYEWSAGRGKAAAVLHSGDVMSADGGTHVIRVRLADLPACATDCFFAISAYNCRNLSLFRSLNVRLLDADSPTYPLSKLVINDVPARESAVVVCALRRRLDTWLVHGLRCACDATVRDYTPIEATIAPLQEKHVRWRSRRQVVLLASLWHCGRAEAARNRSRERSRSRSRDRSRSPRRAVAGELPAADGGKACDIVLPLLKLPTILFQCVVQFM